MYQYPLTLSFASVTATAKINVADAQGKNVFTAAKTLISQKEEFKFTAAGQPLYQVVSQESRISDIPSNWDVFTATGQHIGIVDDDFTGLDAAAEMGVSGVAGMGLNMLQNRVVGGQALKMYWLKDAAGAPLGRITPDKKSISLQQLPLADLTRKLPFAYRFITPRYDVCLGDQVVMTLQKQRTLFVDRYQLESKRTVTPLEESLLLPSIVLAVFYERQQLKHLFE